MSDVHLADLSVISYTSAAAAPPPAESKRGPVRVAVLLNGRDEFFNMSLCSEGYAGGRLAALRLHQAVWTHLCTLTGLTSEIQVTMLIDRRQLVRRLGATIVPFLTAFNSTPGFCCSTVDVGATEGSFASAMSTHIRLQLTSSDYIVMSPPSEDLTEELVSLISECEAQQVSYARILFVDTNSRAEQGVKLTNAVDLGDLLVPTAILTTADWQESATKKATSTVLKEKNGNFGPSASNTPVAYASAASKREASSRPFGNGKGPTTTPKVPALFQPLINAIEQHEAAGFNRPLRSQVAAKLGRAWAGQFSNFKEYALAAQARGLVKMGDGEKLGREWIQLRHSKA